MKKLIVFAWLMFAALTADAQRVVKTQKALPSKMFLSGKKQILSILKPVSIPLTFMMPWFFAAITWMCVF